MKTEDRSQSVDRLPPHSIEAEQAIIGCILLSPNECIDLCIEKMKHGGATFYDLKNREIYDSLIVMHDQRMPIEVLTLHQFLCDKQASERCGGLSYYADLPNKVASSASIAYYIQIVRQKHILRSTIGVCTSIIDGVYECTGDIDEFLDDCEKRLLDINQDRIQSGVLTMKEHMRHAIRRMEERAANPMDVPGIPTGFKGLDKHLLGLSTSHVFVIAARPSLGKTSLAYNIADNVASVGEPVGFISQEMKASDLTERHISARARVDSKRIRTGRVSPEEVERIVTATSAIEQLPIYIDDERGLNVLQLRAKMRRMKQRYGCRMFVIDYLQLLTSSPHSRRENRAQEVAQISSGIKSISGDLDVAVILLSQLNRELEKWGKKGQERRAPTMADLRESGAIEQDADEILLLWTPRAQDQDVVSDEDDWIDVEGLLDKQRNSNKGKVDFRFFKRFTLYADRPRLDHADMEDAARGWLFSGQNNT